MPLELWSNRSPARKALVCPPDVAQGLALLAQWAFLFLATRFASTPYRSQRLDFAWPFDVPVADPIRGQSSTD